MIYSDTLKKPFPKVTSPWSTKGKSLISPFSSESITLVMPLAMLEMNKVIHFQQFKTAVSHTLLLFQWSFSLAFPTILPAWCLSLCCLVLSSTSHAIYCSPLILRHPWRHCLWGRWKNRRYATVVVVSSYKSLHIDVLSKEIKENCLQSIP